MNQGYLLLVRATHISNGVARRATTQLPRVSNTGEHASKLIPTMTTITCITCIVLQLVRMLWMQGVMPRGPLIFHEKVMIHACIQFDTGQFSHNISLLIIWFKNLIGAYLWRKNDCKAHIHLFSGSTWVRVRNVSTSVRMSVHKIRLIWPFKGLFRRFWAKFRPIRTHFGLLRRFWA